MASATTRPVSRLLRREVKFRPVNDADWRWLWAAYQMGMWKEGMPSDLPREGFMEVMTEWLGMANLDWIFEVKGPNGLRPIALAIGLYRAGVRAVEPHIDFFPWATPRQKFEVVATFMKEAGKQYKVFVYADGKTQKFWERIWQYRILKKGCTINDYFAPGESAVFYYTPGPFV